MRSALNLGLKLVAALLVWGQGAAASAQQVQPYKEPRAFTWGELALLPEYCRDVQGVLYTVHGEGKDSPRAPYWVGLMGDDFWHMHHYCLGRREILRASQPGLAPVLRKGLLQRATQEYLYVVRNSRPTMPVMPEVYYKLGEAHLLLDNTVAAMDAFAAARKLKPDYWPAYTRWIDVLLSTKQTDEALKLAREGLVYAPDSAELKQRAAAAERDARKPSRPAPVRSSGSGGTGGAAAAASAP